MSPHSCRGVQQNQDPPDNQQDILFILTVRVLKVGIAPSFTVNVQMICAQHESLTIDFGLRRDYFFLDCREGEFEESNEPISNATGILKSVFYRPNGATNFFDTKVMKDALSRAFVVFYPLAGRLKKGEDGRSEIDCHGQGALFLKAESDGVIDDFGDFAPQPEFLKLFPILEIESDPLLILQVTYFKCGGVSLGVGLHHHVADGKSSIHFMKTWFDIARGLDITPPPFIDRTILRAQDPPQPVFDHVEYHPDPTVLMNESKTVYSSFKLTRDQLNVLKAKTKEAYGSPINYSIFEILSGHVWKCMCKARGLRDNQTTKLKIAVDGRTRLQPPLPPGYFGNVIFTAAAIATAGEIQSEPFWYAASKIHNALAIMNNDRLKSLLDYVELHLDQKPEDYKYTNVQVISWTGLQLHGDFGWGRPIYVGPARLPSRGRCCVLPSPIKDGSLSIIIGLEAEQMMLFSNLLYATTTNRFISSL
ncbi:shikimate O-hydroxycinnamoyltransferase-like [Bidens hawaiensis]|uniref:shikimate O-hydroxycinnamoyltransferase-like n=1 Tax=Bidens hawaiensis TaxID=980011 RepID=UPI0040494FB5